MDALTKARFEQLIAGTQNDTALTTQDFSSYISNFFKSTKDIFAGFTNTFSPQNLFQGVFAKKALPFGTSMITKKTEATVFSSVMGQRVLCPEFIKGDMLKATKGMLEHSISLMAFTDETIKNLNQMLGMIINEEDPSGAISFRGKFNDKEFVRITADIQKLFSDTKSVGFIELGVLYKNKADFIKTGENLVELFNTLGESYITKLGNGNKTILKNLDHVIRTLEVAENKNKTRQAAHEAATATYLVARCCEEIAAVFAKNRELAACYENALAKL